MVRKLSTFLFMFLLFTVIGKAQWNFQGAWPDTNYKGGTHGIAVDPDGKVWTASFFSTPWITGGDTINTRPLLVFNSDGSFVDTIFTVSDGTTADTLFSGCRGLSTDHEGNILYVHSGPNKIIKIDYQTFGRINSALIPEVGSSPTKPGVSDDGTIFIGPVVGGGTTAIAMYDPDLNFLGNAVVGPPAISRTLEVSADGNTIYWTPFTASQMFIYERPDEFSDFALVDSALTGMSIETASRHPVTDNIWVSHDNRGTGPYTHLTWYEYEPSTKALVDSFTLPSPLPTPVDEYPRGFDFSPDGTIAYVGLFGSGYNRINKFSTTTDVRPDPNTLVEDYNLLQNYPNPFNPTTEIKFAVAKEGLVTLKVYDILGKEVATLVNEHMPAGGYTADFNASELSSGTYIYTLSVNGVSISKKMMLLK
jgi:DNA-binding beta-propeller fold protein YncE